MEPASGMIMHACCGSGDQMRVSEIRESRGALEAFQERLFPMVEEVMGADMRANPPETLDVHHVEMGRNVASA